MLRKSSCLLILIILLFLCMGMIVGIYRLLEEWAIYSPEKYPVADTNLILKFIARNPNKPLPTEMYYARYGMDWCWDDLQKIMQQNEYQYQIVLGSVWGANGGASGTTEVVVYINFPNGARIQTQYYGGYLEFCQKVDS